MATLSEYPRQEQMNDARVIAAAPDMLKACEPVLEWAKTPGNHGGNPYTMEFVKLAQQDGNRPNHERILR